MTPVSLTITRITPRLLFSRLGMCHQPYGCIDEQPTEGLMKNSAKPLNDEPNALIRKKLQANLQSTKKR